ncbi:MAG: tail fiber protein [Verrucomicrobiae bacterium]|nr:tail fiber protein [Verrucomicrobiae bacterium]
MPSHLSNASPRRRLAVALAMLAAFGTLNSLSVALGAEPRLLPFQGRLTDAQGQPLPGGTRVVQFKIYDAPVGGRAVWNGEVHHLTVNDGLVNTVLGTRADLSQVDFDRSLYLEITIDANQDGEIGPADPPLLPRQSIIPSFFARESANTRLLGGYDWSPLFGTNNPADGTLLDSKIRDGSLPGAKLQPRSLHAGLLQSNTLTLATLAQEVLDLLVPPGSIMAFGGNTNTIPQGWLLCDGRPVSSATYPRLFQNIGVAWGNGTDDADPSTDFNLPDLSGRFLRGSDGGSGRDPNANARTRSNPGGNQGNRVGTLQNDAFAEHKHFVFLSGQTGLAGEHTHPIHRSDGHEIRWGDGSGNSVDRIDAADSVGADPHRLTAAAAGAHRHSVILSGDSNATGGAETRPRNASVLFLIKH